MADLVAVARRMASRWCRSLADADDVAQEAVIRTLAQPTPPHNLIPWLYVVTRRLSQRQQQRRIAQSSAEAVYLCRNVAAVPNDLILDLQTLLSRLPERDCRLLCRVAEGAVSAELAYEFRCHLRDIGQMIARARRKARALRARGCR